MVLLFTHSKSVNREYEEYVLSVGDFDERIFLDEEAHVEIGTPARSYSFAEVDETQRSAKLMPLDVAAVMGNKKQVLSLQGPKLCFSCCQ